MNESTLCLYVHHVKENKRKFKKAQQRSQMGSTRCLCMSFLSFLLLLMFQHSHAAPKVKAPIISSSQSHESSLLAWRWSHLALKDNRFNRKCLRPFQLLCFWKVGFPRTRSALSRLWDEKIRNVIGWECQFFPIASPKSPVSPL